MNTETRNFKKIALELQDACLIEIARFEDSRGFFSETFNARQLEELGLPTKFVQDNQSFSKPGVLRGLHLQKKKQQAKIIRVVSGEIFDVIVDLRKESPTYRKHVGIRLSGLKPQMLWVPRGFAHGFCVLGTEPALVQYKVDDYFDASDEGGIIWNDPTLSIAWPLKQPILSEKDTQLPRL